jgi:hypothetical protein
VALLQGIKETGSISAARRMVGSPAGQPVLALRNFYRVIAVLLVAIAAVLLIGHGAAQLRTPSLRQAGKSLQVSRRDLSSVLSHPCSMLRAGSYLGVGKLMNFTRAEPACCRKSVQRRMLMALPAIIRALEKAFTASFGSR